VSSTTQQYGRPRNKQSKKAPSAIPRCKWQSPAQRGSGVEKLLYAQNKNDCIGMLMKVPRRSLSCRHSTRTSTSSYWRGQRRVCSDARSAGSNHDQDLQPKAEEDRRNTVAILQWSQDEIPGRSSSAVSSRWQAELRWWHTHAGQTGKSPRNQREAPGKLPPDSKGSGTVQKVPGWMKQCFMSPPTQYKLYGRRFLQVKRPNRQYQSTEGSTCSQTE